MKAIRLPAAAVAPFLPAAATALAAGIFVTDTITDLEIAVPAFYTVVVLLAARFCKKRGVILVGAGCIALTLLSDLLTAASGTSGIGFINTVISVLAVATTTYLIVKIEAERDAVYESRAQLAHIVRVTTLGELTASIAHEVNQPLAATVINGNACLRWLDNNPANLDEVRQAVNRIVKDANRASEIIAQVRALTKGSPPEKAPLAIGEIIRAATLLAENDIHRTAVSLHIAIPGDLPLVLGDRIQLQQVFLNLALNAIEAISLAPDGPRLLKITAERNDNGVLVSVRDSGVGFIMDNRDRLFSAFYSTKPNGMGMGLAISRSIVEAHGGNISAALNSPRGAVFEVTLPSAGMRS